MNVLQRARRVSSAAIVVALSTAVIGACGLFPKKVTEDDCAKWVGHAEDVAISDVKEAAKDCPKDRQKDLNKAVAKGREEDEKKSIKRCKKKVDEKYESKDADCWMKASTLKELRDCKFKLATDAIDDPDKDDDDLDHAVDTLKQIKDACSKSKGKGGDDDGDKPKKKKSSDDDE